MTTKINPFTTDTVQVKWAHLHAPDDKFGADSANHNITVVVDDELQKKLDQLVQENGASKINGLRTDEDGLTTLKAKSKTFVKKDVRVFPCRDAGANRTEAVPFGGDEVRLRLAPAVLTRDNSMSLYLNGVQIITKNAYDESGFEATEGFDGSNFIPPTEKNEEASEDDMPF
tara:strand:+ start:437 stop:952 length:516 start_codon:yes stop_codon:yes gene_type:complete